LPGVTIIRGESDGNMDVDVDRHNGGSWRWDQMGLGAVAAALTPPYVTRQGPSTRHGTRAPRST
jgi:hypothetical protein